MISHLSSEELAKYKYFLELSRLDSSTKPCPQCSLFTFLKGHSQQTSTKSEHKYKVCFSLVFHSVVTMWNNVSKLWIRVTLFAKRLSWVSKLSVYLFKYSSQIQCTKCQFVWCFKCHAPWHEGLKCRDYKKGDKLLRHWASVIEHGQRNAQKCPRCKVMNMLYKNALYVYWKLDFHSFCDITLCTVLQWS